MRAVLADRPDSPPAAGPAVRMELLGVGPQRAGTSWLHECLRTHPDLSFPNGVKETFFFDEHFAKGWEWYASHFRPGAGAWCAEIGPTYFEHPEAAARIHAHNPACRIVVNLRDPAARTFSLYLHHLKKGRVSGTFAEAVAARPELLLPGSRYAQHLPRWFETFGRDGVLVVLHDDIAGAPERVLGQVYEFCGLRSLPLPASAHERVNAASLPRFPRLANLATRGGDWLRRHRLYGAVNFAKRLGLKRVYAGRVGGVPRLDPATRAGLVREFAADIDYVERLLGRELPGWRA